ncbi:MAG: glycerate kinase, partial [Austwickia sp.]|nr:glycerate kinase [Austwickia sp.]
MPRVLVACDKFKGSLTGTQVLEAISAGMRSAAPDLQVSATLIADGGDGTLDAAQSCGFDRVPVTAAGPFGEPVETSYAVRGDQAVIEMADACGIVRAGDRRDALGASSR